MAIIASDKGGSGAPILPAGSYLARCFSMVHIGHVEDTFEGRTKTVNKVRIGFELPLEKYTFSEDRGEEPRTMFKEFTLSLNEKSTLRKSLESWRSVPFTTKELEAFDVQTVLGHPCQLTVTHKVSKTSNKAFATIASINPIMKGIPMPDPITPQVLFAYDLEPDAMIEVLGNLPDFMFKKIEMSSEWKALGSEIKKSAKAAVEAAGAASSPADDAVADAEAVEETATEGSVKPPF